MRAVEEVKPLKEKI